MPRSTLEWQFGLVKRAPVSRGMAHANDVYRLAGNLEIKQVWERPQWKPPQPTVGKLVTRVRIPAEKIPNLLNTRYDPLRGQRIFRRYVGQYRLQLTRRDFGKHHPH